MSWSLAWAVDAQPNQKIVFLEEGAPLIIQQDAVGLKGVFHGLTGPAVLFDELDRAPEELELHQRRFASLPRHGDRGRAVRLQQLADVGLQRGLRHPVLFVRIQRFLRQKEAISAIDVAGGPARLRQQVEARWGPGGQIIVRHCRHMRTISAGLNDLGYSGMRSRRHSTATTERSFVFLRDRLFRPL